MSIDVFISYHRESGAPLASALESALIRFAKPVFSRRALTVFRDDAALTATPSLWNTIAEAIETASHFVLIASTGAAASTWVDKELAHWLKNGTTERLIIVRADGDIVWRGSDFDPNLSTALPDALFGRLLDEPRWLDAAQIDPPYDLSNLAFRDLVAEVASPVRGIPKEMLVGEDLRQHRRLMRLRTGAIAALTTLVIGLAISLWYAESQRGEAVRQAQVARTAALQATGRQLAFEAQVIQRDLTGSIAAARAAALAIESWRMQPSRMAYEAALTALEELPVWVYPHQISGNEDTNAVAFAPNDGRIVHAGSYYTPVHNTNQLTQSGRLSVWSADGRKELYRRDIEGSIESMAIDSAGTRVALALFGGVLMVLRLEDGAEIARMPFKGSVQDIAFAPDGASILLATDRLGARLLDWSSGATLARFSDGLPASAVTFAANGEHIAIATELGYRITEVGEYEYLGDDTALLTLFDAKTFAKVAEFEVSARRINTIAMSPRGDIVAIGATNGAAILLSRGALTEVRRFTHGAAVQSVTFSPDGQWLLTTSTDGTARLISASTGEEAARVAHSRGASNGVFSPDGRHFATGSMDGGVRLLEVASGEQIARIELLGWVREVAFSPDGRYLLGQAGGQSERLFVVERGGRDQVFETDHAVTSLAYTAEGDFLAAADSSGIVRLLETEQFSEVWKLDLGAPIWALDISQDNNALAAVGEGGDLHVLALNDGAERLNIDLGHSLLSVAFQPGGERIAVGGRRPATLELLDARTGELSKGISFFEPHGEGVCCLTFSPSGHRLSAGTPVGTYRVLNGNSLEDLRTEGLAGRVRAAAADKGGLFVIGTDASHQHAFRPAGDSNTGFIRMFSQADGAALDVFEYGAAITAIDIEGNGELVVSGTSKGVGQIIRTSDGLEVARLETGSPIQALRFSPRGDVFVTGTEDGRIESWAMPDTAMTRLCTLRHGRNLSSEEWNRYFGELRPFAQTCENWESSETSKTP